MGLDQKSRKDPWNPLAVLGFTVFAGPIFGGAMGLMNYDRLNIKGTRKMIALLLIAASVAFPFFPLLGFEKFGVGLTMDMSKGIASGSKFILAYYLYITQKDYFNHHILIGGHKASIKGPILVAVVFVVVFLILAGAGLKYFRMI